MSLNLHLSNGIRNKRNKSKPMYEEFSLKQTPTGVTLLLIGLGPARAICDGYIKWLRDNYTDVEDHIEEMQEFRARWPNHEFWYV